MLIGFLLKCESRTSRTPQQLWLPWPHAVLSGSSPHPRATPQCTDPPLHISPSAVLFSRYPMRSFMYLEMFLAYCRAASTPPSQRCSITSTSSAAGRTVMWGQRRRGMIPNRAAADCWAGPRTPRVARKTPMPTAAALPSPLSCVPRGSSAQDDVQVVMAEPISL